MRAWRQQRAANPEARMPLMDHLRELRNRVIKAAIFVALGIVVGFVFFDHVWRFLQEPYCSLPPAARGGEQGCELVYTSIFEGFFLQFKTALIAGLLVSCPFWLYQLWAFVAPALQGRERRFTYYFVAAAVPLFLGGAALAYYITQQAMEILFSFAPEDAVPMITISNYLSYMITMILVFGISFVVPLIVVLLNMLGVVPHAALAKWRRLIIFCICVAAAIVTPAEPFSMLALSIPLVLLFEAAELFCFINDRRRRREDPLAELDDEEISPLEDDDTTGARSDR